jgi:hypothetical protein
VSALNRLHPCELTRCSSAAVEFLVLQPNGLHAECVLTFAPMRLIAHINKTCVCDCSFEVGAEGVINMAKILGVVYRKVIMKVPPMKINNTIYVDLSWTPLKLTTFVIALALQTHGKDHQTVSSIKTDVLHSEWKLTPNALIIQFTYKRSEFTINEHTVTYPKGLTVADFGFVTHSAKHLNYITTQLWRAMVEILIP